MLDTDVDALLHVSRADDLVDNDSDSVGRDVIDDAGFAVVELVGHALVDRAIGLDVDNVANLVGLEVGGELCGALLAECAREEVPSARSVTEGVGHCSVFGCVIEKQG